LNPPILEPLLRRWERSVSLSAADREAVIGLPSARKVFTRDAYLVREGELTTSCNLLLSGFAFRQKLASNGLRQII